MINSFEMLEAIINDSNFNSTREFELIREFTELNENKIGGDVLKSCRVVFGDSAENVKVTGMLIRELKSFEGMDTIDGIKVCGRRADAVYALTNASDEIYFFLTWLII